MKQADECSGSGATLTLPGFDEAPSPGSQAAARPANECDFRDPAFMANRAAPVHRWVPWIAGFSQQFVADAIGRCIDGYGTVLDPFAGVGTTLVEADRVGHEAIGFEINPYATFASRTKLEAHRVDLDQLRAAISEFHSFLVAVRAGKTGNKARLYESVVELRRP